MHAVKVGWVGQTFALAKSNESGGKKSRIRRSKEDRKAMVESFIKRYQISNKGSFPSLNLTHKEVGGSFYTVRELVREIIQENRVLGPAKPVEGEQEVDQFYEQYRLGSISIECESHVSLPSSETHATSSDDYNISKDCTLNGKVSEQKQQRHDSEQHINFILVDEKSKEADASKPLVRVKYAMLPTDIEIDQNSGSMEDIVKISTPRLTPLATDVVVETFPINSTSKITQDVDGRPVEAGKSAVSLEQQEIRRVEVKHELSEYGVLGEKSLEHLTDQPGDQSHHSDLEDYLVLNKMDQDLVVAEKEIRSLEQQESRRVEVKPELSESGVSDEKSLEHLSDQNHHTDLKHDLVLNTVDQNLVVAEKGIKPAPEDIHSMKSDHTGRNQEESLSQGAAVIKSKNDNQNAFSREEGKTSTLNRTKLESWEGPARKSVEAETNPVVAAVKAFISAFVKFWTE